MNGLIQYTYTYHVYIFHAIFDGPLVNEYKVNKILFSCLSIFVEIYLIFGIEIKVQDQCALPRPHIVLF